jgi:hypothetical protein
MTSPNGAEPPPYPAPGWGSGDAPPNGWHWEWAKAHDGWRPDGEGKRCRFTVGPNRQSCKRPAVATLDRGHGPMAPNRWAYCEQHLYGRHLHDGALWECHLKPDVEDAP